LLGLDKLAEEKRQAMQQTNSTSQSSATTSSLKKPTTDVTTKKDDTFEFKRPKPISQRLSFRDEGKYMDERNIEMAEINENIMYR
jgi:hypothetical protein